MKYDFSEIKFQVWKWFYDKYIFVKDILFPWNRLKIRNISRHYHDKDIILVHAMFTVVCNYIENEYKGGRGGVIKYIERCKIENMSLGWVEALTTFIEIYDWYKSIDWDNPVPHSQEYHVELKKAFDGIGECKSDYFKVDFSERCDELFKLHHKKEQDFTETMEKHLMNIVKYRKYLWT